MKKLVVIDDEHIVVAGIKAMITKLGSNYEVVGHAYDGLTAVKVIYEETPDLVITDIRMPGMDGLSLIETVKDTLPNTDFVIISGYQEFEYARQALSLGVKGYIDKPITMDKLSALFEKLSREEVGKKEDKDRKNRYMNEFINYIRYGEKDKILLGFDKVLEEYKILSSDFENYRSEVYKAICVSIGIFFEQHRIYDVDKYFPSYKNLELLKTVEETDDYAKALITRIVEKLDFLDLGNIHQTVNKLVEFINAEYSKDIGLNEFADSVGMNPAYLSILFKREVGVSYVKYLTKVRLDHAKGFLKNGEKVVDVSRKVGYQDYRYFCNIFKKNVGQTPNEFRGNIRKAEK